MKSINIFLITTLLFLNSCSKQNSNNSTSPKTLYKFGFKIDGVPYSAEFEKGYLYNGSESSYSIITNNQGFLNFHSPNHSISMNSQLLGITTGSITINRLVALQGFSFNLCFDNNCVGINGNGDSILINFQSVSPNSIQNSDSTKAGKAIGSFSGRLSNKIITEGYFEAIRVK